MKVSLFSVSAILMVLLGCSGKVLKKGIPPPLDYAGETMQEQEAFVNAVRDKDLKNEQAKTFKSP